jgi:hypothetical protein
VDCILHWLALLRVRKSLVLRYLELYSSDGQKNLGRKHGIRRKLLVRKEGLEPSRFYPPDPKFASHEKSTTCMDLHGGYKEQYSCGDSGTAEAVPVTPCNSIRFAAGHKFGHSADAYKRSRGERQGPGLFLKIATSYLLVPKQ